MQGIGQPARAAAPRSREHARTRSACPQSWTERYPHEFSGGQRQRLGFARALLLNPQLIVADEPVSALDVSVQAQVLNMMRDLQQETGLTYMFISHDLSVVRYLSNHIGVMYLGKLVEIGPADEVYLRPAHPYTKGLIESGADRRPGDGAGQGARGHHRRTAERDAPAVRLPVPHPLPDRAGDLLDQGAGAEAVRHRPRLAACHFALQPPVEATGPRWRASRS